MGSRALIATAVVMPVAQMGGDGGMGWGIVMMAVMILFAVLVVAAVVWLIVHLVRERNGPRPAQGDGDEALQVLERRFAAGEIDANEYRERRSTLEGAR